LLDFLEDQPTAYLDKIQDFLYCKYDVWASLMTIFQTLQHQNWSWKVVQQCAAERSASLYNAWKGLMLKWNASELVFLDESAANKQTSDRKRSWSLRGLSCPTSVPIKRSER
jgi:hypothetical protein